MKEKRRIIIFDKKKNKIVYDEPVSIFGCKDTNLTNLRVLDCLEENVEWVRKNIPKRGKSRR